MYGLELKGVNACISLVLESVLIVSEAKGLSPGMRLPSIFDDPVVCVYIHYTSLELDILTLYYMYKLLLHVSA